MKGEMLRVWALISIQLLVSASAIPQVNNASSNATTSHHHAEGIELFKINFTSVKVPFIFCVWVLTASLAKVLFHQKEWLSSNIPESVLLIILGVPLGFIVEEVVDTHHELALTYELFFYFLLPPIILDAGYFMTTDIFFKNIGTILLYAVFGTIFNYFAVGLSMYGVSGVCGVKISMLQSLVFGSLISAVDPVAVLAVFEEVHVNEILYILVFGESVLNDAASVVLYRTFGHMTPDNINAEQIVLAVASFFIVSLGGTLIGVIFAMLGSFITRFTNHVLVIEPIFVFLIPYMAYLVAEIFHFSGIMSILFCGLIMRPYVEANVSHKSHSTIKSFLKLMSSTSEAIIFMFLGVSIVQFDHFFNIKFILFTLLFITLFRALAVIELTWYANTFGRLFKVSKVEQFIMAYGGLRGAVAFCLAMTLEPNDCSGKGTPLTVDQKTRCQLKAVVVTTTISIVMFTVIVQGCTMKTLVEKLGIKKSTKHEKSMVETLNDRVSSFVVAGIEEILGLHNYGYWMNRFELFNRRYLRRWLEKEPDLALDEELVHTEKKIAFKRAMSSARKTMQADDSKQDAPPLTFGKSISEYDNTGSSGEQQLTGKDNGLVDTPVIGATPNSDCDQNVFDSEVISSILPKAKPSLKHRVHNPGLRKYSLHALEESEAHSQERILQRQRTSQIENLRQQNKGEGQGEGGLRFRKKKKQQKNDCEGGSSEEILSLPIVITDFDDFAPRD